MFPALSTATPRGLEKVAKEAGPPSPRAWLAPARVLITPVASTIRTLLLFWSAMYMFPAASNATPVGLLRLADKACPPSPTPFGLAPPATVLTRLQPTGGTVRTPFTVVAQVAVFHFRMRLLPLSAMYKNVPVESM